MKVFVLMADGGYDGDALLGVYASRDDADQAGRKWTPPSHMRDYASYVIECEVGSPAALRDSKPY